MMVMCDMSEERFEFTINSNGQADIIDKVESKEKNAICIYNDLGVPPYSSAKAVCDLLNEQEERITILEKEKESWKNSACHDTNLKSMLSFEIGKLTETKDIDAFLDFYYKYFCESGDVE